MKKIFILLFTFSLAHCVFAQKQFTQTVRGTVTSTYPESNIFSASILVLGSDPLIGTITDENNDFNLKNNWTIFTDLKAMDLQNTTNRINVLGLSYDLQKHKYVEMLLPGFMPMLTYKYYFSI